MIRHRSDGFTLLEVLVAVTVMGFLLAGLSQATRFGLRAWDIQARMIDQHGELDAVDRTLRRLIQQLDPGNPTTGAALAGNARRIVFTSDLPMAAASAARRADMILTVDTAHRLMLRWTPHLHVRRVGPPAAPHDIELLRGVDRLELGYWRRDGAGGWLNQWSDRELPSLIRIRIVFVEGDGRTSPDIVAAPMLGRQDS